MKDDMTQTVLKRLSQIKTFPYLTKNTSELKYFLNFTGSNGVLLVINPERFLFFTDSRYFDIYEASFKEKIRLLELSKGKTLFEFLINELSILGIKNCFLDPTLWTYEEFSLFLEQAKTSFIKVEKISDNIKPLRRKKNWQEVKEIEESQLVVQKALLSLLGFIKEGVSEFDLSLELEYLIKKQGASSLSFDSIVLFGERTALPHGSPSGERTLKYGDVILIDVGACYHLYCSDMTRMFSFGEPKDKEFISHYNFLLDIQIETLDKIKEGIFYGDLDSFVREKLKEKELESYFIHSLGHGVGIDVHEFPRIHSSNKVDMIQKGDVFTVEPGIYFKGKYGIRIEDLVFLNQKNQLEILSSFPKDLLIL